MKEIQYRTLSSTKYYNAQHKIAFKDETTKMQVEIHKTILLINLQQLAHVLLVCKIIKQQ